MNFSLNNFNPQQKKVITHILGPLLVISGAGTGKTHVLTGKILHLLLEKNVKYEEILALTFTEKATAEMMQRLDSALPIGHSDVWVKTFHAFCETVLRESGHEIGLPLDYKVIQGADLWLFLKRHIADFKLDYYRPLGNPQKFLAAMQEYFSRLQDEDITPQDYAVYVKKLLQAAKTDEEKEFAEKHLELAQAYNTYIKILIENCYLDFGGLIYHTLRLFEKRPSVLAAYQKRFNYILVDEFQDTNYAQNKLVTLLAQKHRNLMVVGDDDQSIYKWRGASLTNIQYFQKLFPEAKNIVLNENYRSKQEILDLAYAVIQKNNPNRLEINQKVNKNLTSTPKKIQVKQDKILPQIYHFAEFNDELNFIAEKATNALKRGMDTAILVRTNAFAMQFLEKFQKEGVPYQHFSQSALFNKPGVKDCIAFLKVINDPWNDIALFRFLSLPFWKIPMELLLKINKTAKYASNALFDLLNGRELTPVKKLIREMMEYARQHTITEVLGKFLNKSGYIKNASDETLKDLALFSEKVALFENTHTEKYVPDFLQFAQLLEEVGEPKNSGELIDPNSIKVLTIHGSKGLEFDAVFVPGLAAGKFPAISRKEPFEIPQTIIPEPLPQGDHHMEEERRLFYVALTRAKESLTLSYSDFYNSKKQWKASPFINEAVASGKSILHERGNKKSKISKQQSELPLEKRQHRPIKFILPKLSYSQLDTFITCPLKYQYRYIWNIQVPMPSQVSFGSSIHNTLRDFYAFLQKNPEKISKDLLPVLQEIFEKNWIPFGYESREEQKMQKKAGLASLERFYMHEKKNLIVPKFLEKSFTLKIDEIILSGRIDRIDQLEDGTYEVIDYKTGSNNQKNLNKDLQLSIYALACRDSLKLPVSKLSLYFIDDLEKVSTVRTKADLEKCKIEILKYAEGLKKSDFSPVPGYHCGFCDYRLICSKAASIAI